MIGVQRQECSCQAQGRGDARERDRRGRSRALAARSSGYQCHVQRLDLPAHCGGQLADGRVLSNSVDGGRQRLCAAAGREVQHAGEKVEGLGAEAFGFTHIGEENRGEEQTCKVLGCGRTVVVRPSQEKKKKTCLTT
jgi:hypothetical protein